MTDDEKLVLKILDSMSQRMDMFEQVLMNLMQAFEALKEAK